MDEETLDQVRFYEKSLLNQNYPLEEAFTKGGNSDKDKLIPFHAVIISDLIS